VRRESVADSWQIWGSRQGFWQERQEARRQEGTRHVKREERWVERVREAREAVRR